MVVELSVELRGAPQTMLAALYAKALDADVPEPILGDRYARDIAELPRQLFSAGTATTVRVDCIGDQRPDEMLAAVPNTRLLAWVRWYESATFARLPRRHRCWAGPCRWCRPWPTWRNTTATHSESTDSWECPSPRGVTPAIHREEMPP
ncbi:O-methyltransferase domain protein [Mycobacterium xenopi 3993]|nr:O-methyltransferase domain protein [Mycobacterium xenopi 3993]